MQLSILIRKICINPRSQYFDTRTLLLSILTDCYREIESSFRKGEESCLKHFIYIFYYFVSNHQTSTTCESHFGLSNYLQETTGATKMKDDVSYVVNILASMRADQKDHLYSQFGEAYSDVSFIDVHFFATEFLYMFRLFLFLPSHFDSIGKLFPDGLWMSENISICTPLRLMRQLLTQTGYNSPYSQKANGKCWPFPAFSFQVCKKTFILPYLDALAVEETTVFPICMAKNAIFFNAVLSRCLHYSVCISSYPSIYISLPLPLFHFVCLCLSVSI